jgi:hypothetical protein
VLEFKRVDGSAHGGISCVFSGRYPTYKSYGCTWAIGFTRRATYWGLAMVKFYRPGPNYDIELAWSKCRAVSGSTLCRR